MDQQIIDFVNSQRICILAIEMMDGSPHASTLHFAVNENPLTFFFSTSRSYRKSEPLLGRELSRASLVIGFDESNMKTFQLDGEVKRVTTEEDKKLFDKIFLEKFPEKAKKSPNPDSVSFSFTPLWWRYTDWNGPNGKLVLTSEDK